MDHVAIGSSMYFTPGVSSSPTGFSSKEIICEEVQLDKEDITNMQMCEAQSIVNPHFTYE